MSIKLMTAIWYTEFIDLPTGEKHDDGKEKFVRSTSAKITLLAIADQANDEGESAYPGYTRLELKTGLSRQGVADVIKALRYNGIVETSEKPSKLNTNDYKINLSCFPRLRDENARVLVVNSLDQSSHLTSDSQATLPEVVKPLDLKHTLNQQETKQVLSSADKTVDGILAFEKKAQEATQSGNWQGRENTPSHLLKYADWWNSKTGQEMKGKVRADWFKEFTRWNEEQVSLSALEEAFEHVKGWKRIVSKPSDVTNDAIAINALPKPNKPEAAITQEGGFYV